MTQEMTKAAAVLTRYLAKSLSKATSKGEGSRGGKVISHTKSGRPIYAVSHVRHELMNSNNLNKQGHYVAMTHRKYSAQDHADASDHYDKLRDAEPEGKERLHLHKISLAHTYARHIKESGEHNAIRDTMKPGSKKATADHWAAANHFNKKFSTDAQRHQIDKTEKSFGKSEGNDMDDNMFKASGEGSRGGKIIGHTRSNKPIYESSHESYHTAAGKEGKSVHETMKTPGVTAITKVAAVMKHTHPNWSQEDHEDAKIVHGGKGQGGMGDAHAFAASIMNRRRVFADERVARNAQAKRVKVGKVTKSEGNGLDDNLFKATGEGSRGGKIIGHTKSGKPVYAGRSAGHESHASWNVADHRDAAALHANEAKEHGAAFAHNMKTNGGVEEAVHAQRSKRQQLSFAEAHTAAAGKIVARKQKASEQVDDLMQRQRLASMASGVSAVRNARAKRAGAGKVTKSEGNGLDINDLTPSLLEAHSPDDFNTQAAAISGATMWGPTVMAGDGSH